MRVWPTARSLTLSCKTWSHWKITHLFYFVWFVHFPQGFTIHVSNNNYFVSLKIKSEARIFLGRPCLFKLVLYLEMIGVITLHCCFDSTFVNEIRVSSSITMYSNSPSRSIVKCCKYVQSEAIHFCLWVSKIFKPHLAHIFVRKFHSHNVDHETLVNY